MESADIHCSTLTCYKIDTSLYSLLTSYTHTPRCHLYFTSLHKTSFTSHAQLQSTELNDVIGPVNVKFVFNYKSKLC